MTVAPAQLHDYLARVLLRYFRDGRAATIEKPRLRDAEDLDLLRLHWAASAVVRILCEHVVLHRHEVQSAFTERLRFDDAVVRGRIDARRTQHERALSGHPTRVVFAEQVRAYTTGPNHVLVWVIQRAHLLLNRFAAEADQASGYARLVEDARRAVTAAKRVGNVAQAISEADYTQRPSPQSLAQAAAARRPLYQLAHQAYASLKRIEAGDEAAVAQLLRATLVAPLHDWQALELAAALGMASALAEAQGCEVQFTRIVPGGGGAILTAGSFSLFWQTRTAKYVPPPLEPSEKRTADILTAYGVDGGDDRPDIVIVEATSGRVVAVAEMKYYTDETDGWRSALRSAVPQLVRYARGYASDEVLDEVLRRSLVGLWVYPPNVRPCTKPDNTPTVIDFFDLSQNRLSDWARRLHPAPVESYSAA
jgi:hypothetical protein